MIVNYDSQKLHTVFMHFYHLTGITMNFSQNIYSASNPEMSALNSGFCNSIRGCTAGLKCCYASDRDIYQTCQKSRKPEWHICHAGLIDVVIPILYRNNLLGFVHFGQIRTSQDFSKIKDHISHLPLDMTAMSKHYDKLIAYDKTKLESLIYIATLLVNHILTENMLTMNFDMNMKKILSYIDQNLHQPLSIETITKNVHISKNVLYHNFRTYFNCTVNEYITRARIDKSMELLCNTDFPIDLIAQKIGFSTSTHFSKTFKALNGISPLKFRKLNTIPAKPSK